MGKKPVLGLVGALWVGLALSGSGGCESTGSKYKGANKSTFNVTGTNNGGNGGAVAQQGVPSGGPGVAGAGAVGQPAGAPSGGFQQAGVSQPVGSGQPTWPTPPAGAGVVPADVTGRPVAPAVRIPAGGVPPAGNGGVSLPPNVSVPASGGVAPPPQAAEPQMPNVTTQSHLPPQGFGNEDQFTQVPTKTMNPPGVVGAEGRGVGNIPPPPPPVTTPPMPVTTPTEQVRTPIGGSEPAPPPVSTRAMPVPPSPQPPPLPSNIPAGPSAVPGSIPVGMPQN